MIYYQVVISKWEMRDLCIKYHWYTRGDSKAYDNMLDMCDDAGGSVKMTEELLNKLTEDILLHSDWTDLEENGYDTQDIMERVAWLIMNEGTTTRIYFNKEG